MKHQLKSRFVASDLAVGCLRAVVDVFRVVDLVCLVFFLFISLFSLLLGKKEHFNECSTLFLTLFGKNTVMPTLSTVELFSSVCVYVVFLLSRLLKISYEAYMVSWRQDNAQVCSTFSQISFIQSATQRVIAIPSKTRHRPDFVSEFEWFHRLLWKQKLIVQLRFDINWPKIGRRLGSENGSRLEHRILMKHFCISVMLFFFCRWHRKRKRNSVTVGMNAVLIDHMFSVLSSKESVTFYRTTCGFSKLHLVER